MPLSGVTATLASILKAGLRQQLLPVVAAVWPAAVRLPASPVAATNVLARKLAVKLVQRLVRQTCLMTQNKTVQHRYRHTLKPIVPLVRQLPRDPVTVKP